MNDKKYYINVSSGVNYYQWERNLKVLKYIMIFILIFMFYKR